MENNQYDILFIIGTPMDSAVPGAEEKVNKYGTEPEEIVELVGSVV